MQIVQCLESFKESCDLTIGFHWQKSGRLIILEWAVPKLFIHLWVDKMALLSMMSKFHFKSMISLRLGYANYIVNLVSKRGVT